MDIFKDFQRDGESSENDKGGICLNFFCIMFQYEDRGELTHEEGRELHRKTMNAEIECPFLSECKKGKKALKEGRTFKWAERQKEEITQKFDF